MKGHQDADRTVFKLNNEWCTAVVANSLHPIFSMKLCMPWLPLATRRQSKGSSHHRCSSSALGQTIGAWRDHRYPPICIICLSLYLLVLILCLNSRGSLNCEVCNCLPALWMILKMVHVHSHLIISGISCHVGFSLQGCASLWCSLCMRRDERGLPILNKIIIFPSSLKQTRNTK